jgi:hypothetical protein
VNATVRRQDRPAHRGEAPDEEARLAPDDVMVRLEPGDHARPALVLDLAEAHKGVHLVRVTAHLLGHALQPLHQRIGAILHRLRWPDAGKQA